MTGALLVWALASIIAIGLLVDLGRRVSRLERRWSRTLTPPMLPPASIIRCEERLRRRLREDLRASLITRAQ